MIGQQRSTLRLQWQTDPAVSHGGMDSAWAGLSDDVIMSHVIGHVALLGLAWLALETPVIIVMVTVR